MEKTGLPSWCWSYRFSVGILCCLAVVNMQALQSAFFALSGCDTNVTASDRQSNSFSSVACQTLPNSSMASSHSVIPAGTFWKFEGLTPGVFSWGYLISILPSGMIASWTGGRKTLGYSHLTMSLTALLVPVAMGFMHSYTVAGLKFIAGMMAGATYPSVMAIWQKWAPPEERTKLLAVTYSGIPIGILFTSSTKQVLCYHGWLGVDSWSGLLYVLGSFGVMWFVLWMLLISSRPETNKRITSAEKRAIIKCLNEERDVMKKRHDDVMLIHIVKSGAFWALVVAQVATEWSLHMLVYVVPLYLYSVLEINIYTFFNGYFYTVPVCSFMLVLLLSGYVFDRVFWPKRIKFVRKITSVYGSIMLAIGFVIMSAFDCRHSILVLASYGLAFGTHALQYCSVMVVALELNRRHSVMVTTLSLMIAHFVKFVGIIAVNFISSQEEASDWSWFVIFYVSSSLSMLAGISISIFGSFHALSPPITTEPEPVVAIGSTIDMLTSRDNSTNIIAADCYASGGGSNTYSFPSMDHHRATTGLIRVADGRAAAGGAYTGSSVVSVV